MAVIKLGGSPIHTKGDIPVAGAFALDFRLTKTDLTDVGLKDFSGKRIVMNIFASLDTSVCAASVRRFNSEAEKLVNTVVLCISKDLPFAHKRFCTAEGLDNVVSLSELRNNDFGNKYGIRIIDGPMEGLLARGVIIIDETGKVIYSELVPEIKQEPDYKKALAALK